MPNLPQESKFPAGIYQLELNDLRIATAIPNGTGNVSATIVTEWAQVKA